MATYFYIPFEMTTSTEPLCSRCDGSGVSGEHYGYEIPDGVMLVDVFCSECGGCGASEHTACTASLHDALIGAEPEWFDSDPEEPRPCPSCSGREWNALQAVRGEGDEMETVILRMPCGCVQERTQRVPA